MVVKVTYPHDPERLDRWIGKHASVIQATLSLTWLAVSVLSVLLMVLWDWRLVLLIPVWSVPTGFFGWWSYQEGGGGGDGGNEG